MRDGESLELELLAAAAGMPFAAVRRLLDLGMDAGALARLLGAGALGRARVQVSREGLFQFDPEGGEARLILGVWEAGAMIDLVAISGSDRDAWALRCGVATILGEEWIEEADALVMTERAPKGSGVVLRLYGTPLDWLISGGSEPESRAICVLDWTPAALARLRALGSKVTLACDDAAAAERLRGVLVHAGLPKVVAAGRGDTHPRLRSVAARDERVKVAA